MSVVLKSQIPNVIPKAVQKIPSVGKTGGMLSKMYELFQKLVSRPEKSLHNLVMNPTASLQL
jgi:hypothetical protein